MTTEDAEAGDGDLFAEDHLDAEAEENNATVAPPLYPHVYAFIQEYLSILWARSIRDQQGPERWCSQWWKHPDALALLDALWRAFEKLRLDPEMGGATWWLGYAEPTRRILMDSSGTFAACGPTTHRLQPPLVVQAPSAAELEALIG